MPTGVILLLAFGPAKQVWPLAGAVSLMRTAFHMMCFDL